MSEEVEILYMSLNQLLDDICTFLKTDVNREALTPEARKQADKLISRSKVQLQKISNVTKELNPNEYLDMQTKIFEGKKEIKTNEEKNISKNSESCPYSDTPAKNFPQEEKYGYIAWKTKFIFGFEKLKRIYAGTFGNWLLIYYNEKDSKPSHTYNLKIHKAQMLVINNHSENSTQYFSLINLETQSRSQFVAQTHKDMIQWVAKINKCHQIMHQRQSPKIEAPTEEVEELDTEDENMETYDVLTVENKKTSEVEEELEEEIEEDEVYIDIEFKPISPPSQVLTKNDKNIPPPPSRLPTAMNKLQKTPLPALPVDENTSTESLPSYDCLQPIKNPIEQQKQKQFKYQDSFSESEEEAIYDEVAAPPQPKLKSVIKEPAIGRLNSIKKDSVENFKPAVMPKPPKPIINAKIIKPSPGVTSTKQILKLAREASMK